MIKTFDSTNLKQLRVDLDAAFATVKAKHGVVLSLGAISYDPTAGRATGRLTMIATGDPNVGDPEVAALAKAKAEFKIYADSFGLKPEQFGAIFKYGHTTYKLVGLKPRRPQYPILATSAADGRTYKLPEAAIVSLQSKEHTNLFGSAPITPVPMGQCSEEHAFDLKTMKNIGQCKKPATTRRKDGFGRSGRIRPFCDDCAKVRDESRAEMEAEARANRY
jgi:hypothetical protein